MDNSIIICTYNRCESLRRTLGSLARLEIPAGVQWDVVVVDNNSSDATRGVCLEFHGKLPLRYLFEARQGKSYALNRAVSETTASLLAFADDDVEVEPAWVAAMWSAFLAHPDVSFLGGRVFPRWERVPPTWIGASDHHALSSAFVRFDCGPEERLLVGERNRLFMGANIAVCRRVFDAGYRFDERIGPKGREAINGEESDLQLRLLRDGHKGLYVPSAVVHHHNPPERATESFLRRYFKGQGICETRLEGTGGESPLWYGAPRWLWRILIPRVVRFCMARAFSSPKTWVPAEIEMAKTWGRVCEWRRQTRSLESGKHAAVAPMGRDVAGDGTREDASAAGPRRCRIGILLADHGTTLGGGPIGVGRFIERMDRAKWEFFVYARTGVQVEDMVRDPGILTIRRFDRKVREAEAGTASDGGPNGGSGGGVALRSRAALRRMARDLWRRAPVRLARYAGGLADAGRLTRMLSSDSIDLLYCFSGPRLLAMSLGRMRCRLVLRYTSPPPMFRVPRRYHRALRRCFRYADAVVTCSGACRNDWHEYLGRQALSMKLIYNGVDVDAFSPVDRASVRASLPRVSGGPIVGAIGRLAEEKGFDVLIRAMPKVLEAVPGARLVVVGDGASRPALESLARECGVAENICFMGWQRDAARLNLGFDVAVVPSVWSEPFSNVVLEAMAAATPVVATRAGGTPEVVVEGETGWLVPPADAEALALAIIDALSDPARLKEMGLAARKHVAAHFSLDANREAHERLFEELLREDKPPDPNRERSDGSRLS